MIINFPVSTNEKISVFLEVANYKFHIEDDEYYLSEQFNIPCWIIPRDDVGYTLIKMRVKVKTRRQEDERRILQFVNYLNRNYLPNSYYYEDGFLYGEHYILGNLTNSGKQFIETLDWCVLIFKEAISEDDKYNLISTGNHSP